MDTAKSKEDLGDRTKYIGASDVGPILGLSPYQTTYDVWLQKTGRVPPVDLSDNKAAEAGTILESSILDWAEKDLGVIKRKIEIRIPGLGFPLTVHLDGLTADLCPVEAKTSGLFSPLHTNWGEPGTDSVPDFVAIQVQTQIIGCAGDMGYIPAFLGGRGFSMYRIPSSKELQSMICEALGTFWNDYVIKDTPPEGGQASLNIVSQIYRVPESTIEIDPVLIDKYVVSSEAAKDATKIKNNAKAALLTALGDAEAGTVDDVVRLTYFERDKKGFTVAPTTFRQLYLKKVK